MTADDDKLTARIQIVASPSMLRAIDAWRRKQPTIPTRSEAIRGFIELALKELAAKK